jgi:hypothetical protein
MNVARTRRDWPVITGLAEGSAFAAIGMIAAVAMGIPRVEWPLVALVMLGFPRPVAYQAALIFPACLMCSVFSSHGINGFAIPAAAALIAGNVIARTEDARRWTPEHIVFSVSAFMFYFVASCLYRPALDVLLGAFATALVILFWWTVAGALRVSGALARHPREISLAHGGSAE